MQHEIVRESGREDQRCAFNRQNDAWFLQARHLIRVRSAQRAGDTATANILDDLERVLMEIANSPSTLSNGQLQQFQKEIEDRGLLFKVRVVGSQARQRESKPLGKEKL